MAELKPVTYIDFSGGMNAVSNPFDLAKKQMQLVRNLTLDEHGSLRTRDGSAIIKSSPVNTSILTLSGLDPLIAITGNGVANNVVYNTNFVPWTNLGTLKTAFTIPQIVPFNDYQIIANGYETPWQTDGSSLTQLGNDVGLPIPAGAKHIANHLGSLWLWNTAATSGAGVGPSSLQMSDANNQNSWPVQNQVYIAKDDGQEGMGLSLYTIAETGISPLATLLVFKNFSAYEITGVFGSAIFSIQKTKSDLGCTAPRTIQFCTGFGVIRFSHKGFALYNGVEDKLLSEEVRPYIFGRDQIAGIDTTRTLQAWSAQSVNPPLYVSAFALLGSTALSRVFIYDLVRKAWTIADFPFNITTLENYYPTQDVPKIIAGDLDTPSKVRQLFAGNTTDSGAAVSWEFTSRPESGRSPLARTYYRRVEVIFEYIAPITVTATVTIGNVALPATTITLPPSAGAADWGTGVWNTMLWGGNAKVSAASIPIHRIAENATLNLTGTGPIKIRGIEWHIKPKPLNRVVTRAGN